MTSRLPAGKECRLTSEGTFVWRILDVQEILGHVAMPEKQLLLDLKHSLRVGEGLGVTHVVEPWKSQRRSATEAGAKEDGLTFA